MAWLKPADGLSLFHFFMSMTSFSAASSDVSSENSETGKSSGDPLVQRPCCHWLPRSYLLVFVINATATGLLWPADTWLDDRPCALQMRLFFSGLMLSSFGAGCVAAFLVRRAEASPHTRWACGYAVVNWIQAILGSQSMHSPFGGWCRFGVLPYGNLEGERWYLGLALCRGLLYFVALFWMQTLIASRLYLLEKSSKRNYGSACFRGLMWAQFFGAAMTLLLGIFAYLATGDDGVYGVCFSPSTRCGSFLMYGSGTTLLCNIAASMLAICSLGKSFLELRHVSRLAEATEASPSAVDSLRRARRFAGLQAIGVSLSLVFTLLLVPACFYGTDAEWVLPEYGWVTVACFFIQAVDPLGNAVAVLLLSGSHRMPKVEGRQPSWCCKVGKREHVPQKDGPSHAETDTTWSRKVEELSMRGMTLRSLLQFYQDELPSMPDWTYVPNEHKTRDVVRRAIIPLTGREECAFAASAFNRDGPRRAQVMVTHNWGNSFGDLLAAVLSDALQECSFTLPAQLLQEECAFLQDLLAKMGRLDDTYWVCAFAVNQHISICHSNPYDRDPFTNELHPVCHCGSTNIVDPDGRSAASEINKFDDMMCLLAKTAGCRQVIAVDKSLDFGIRKLALLLKVR